MKKILKNKKGQTTVEYIFILVVAVSLTLAFAGKFKKWIVGMGDCPNDSLTCKMLEKYGGAGYLDANSRFRYFSLRR